MFSNFSENVKMIFPVDTKYEKDGIPKLENIGKTVFQNFFEYLKDDIFQLT